MSRRQAADVEELWLRYVMVPCPEEHVQVVMANLMRMSFSVAGWDDERLDAFVDDLTDVERELVTVVARASARSEHLPYREAARAVGVEVGDVLDMVTVVNDRCREASRPLPLVTETHPISVDGGPAVPTAVLALMRPVAERLLPRLEAATGDA